MRKIYTIGHSTKKWEVFLKEIESVDYDKLIDIRRIVILIIII